MLRSVFSRFLCSPTRNFIPSRTFSSAANASQSNDSFKTLDEYVKVAQTILNQEPPVSSLRELYQRRDSTAKLRDALQYIEENRDLYLKRNLLLGYAASRPAKAPVRVAVTGAAGAIGYSLIFRIASGDMLGKDQPVHLCLLELPPALNALKGVVMELEDCAFPLLSGVTATTVTEEAFDGISYALLVGAQPRSKGMERGDLLKKNAAIFSTQGKALNKVAKPKDLKVVVVGNPANTNAYIAANNAKDLSPQSFSAMTRLDHNRGLAQISSKLHVPVTEIKRFAIWGNHSSTQYPDVSHTQVQEKWAKNLLDDNWIKTHFIPTVQQRGAAIIAARGSSSAASAASAAIDHIRDWSDGTKGEWTSMAVYSDKSYGITEGLYYSYPVVCEGGNYSIVKNVPIDPFSAERMEATHKELLSERDAVREFIPN